MDKADIIALFEKYKEGMCTGEEIRLLHDWLEQGVFDSHDISPEEILADIRLIEGNLPLKRSETNYQLYRRLAIYAASIVVVLGMAYYYYQFIFFDQTPSTASSTAIAALEPGSNKAILQLDDGSSILLDTLVQDRFVEIDGARVRLNADGQLVYLAGQSLDLPKHNQIITPKGGQYEVVLADGTRVWLNSESRLSFVNSFDNLPERRVELKGEAYFSVSRNVDQPFVVSVNGQSITVLGTEFNVNAYSENDYIKTSLVEGSVLFNKNRLTPGESALFKDEKMSIYQENMDDITAWKNGYFVFFEESLEDAMKKISRWYDLEVSFTDEGAKSILFGGSISKYENASKVFKMIERAGNVKITAHGRKISINRVSNH